MFADHRKYFTPELLALTATTLVTVLIFICFSVYLRPDGMTFAYHFVNEEGAITILSVTNLSIASLLAYACFFIKPTVCKRQRVFFLIAAFALTYLAVDEVMHFHENLGDSIDYYRVMRKVTNRLHIRGWNDMIIIIYGLAAIPVAIYFLPTATKIPCIPEYFLAAFICYAAHTGIDSFVSPPTTLSYIIEESMKVYTSAFLVLGLVSGSIFLIDAKNLSRSKSESD